MNPVLPVLAGVSAYLLGSIPIGYLLLKWGKGVDIRRQGSGNIGMTNVWRVAGAKWGIPTLILDLSKGILAVAAARWVAEGTEWLPPLAGLSVLMGNIFPIFLGFKGGKGIGVSAGVFFTLLPLETAAALAVFLVALFFTRMVSAGSLLGALTLAGFTLCNRSFGWTTSLALVATVVVWWTHRANIQRILKGTENKIGARKKP